MPGQTARENGKLGGRPKGRKSDSTLAREAISNAINQRIMEAADAILTGQISLARGQSFLYKIEKTRIVGPKGGVSYRSERPKLVTSEFEIEQYLAGVVDAGEVDDSPGATYYYITTKEPSNMAIDSMFNRALGKAVESVDITSKGEAVGATTNININQFAAEVALKLKEKKLNEPDTGTTVSTYSSANERGASGG